MIWKLAAQRHGLKEVASIIHRERGDLRPTSDPLPVARACREFESRSDAAAAAAAAVCGVRAAESSTGPNSASTPAPVVAQRQEMAMAQQGSGGTNSGGGLSRVAAARSASLWGGQCKSTWWITFTLAEESWVLSQHANGKQWDLTLCDNKR